MKLSFNVPEIKVAQKLEACPSSDAVLIVTFNDNTKAYASKKKHLNGSDPLFLNDRNELAAGWDIVTIDGRPWVRDTTKVNNALPAL